MCRVKVSAAATHPCCLDVNKAPRVLGEAADSSECARCDGRPRGGSIFAWQGKKPKKVQIQWGVM